MFCLLRRPTVPHKKSCQPSLWINENAIKHLNVSSWTDLPKRVAEWWIFCYFSPPFYTAPQWESNPQISGYHWLIKKKEAKVFSVNICTLICAGWSVCFAILSHFTMTTMNTAGWQQHTCWGGVYTDLIAGGLSQGERSREIHSRVFFRRTCRQGRSGVTECFIIGLWWISQSIRANKWLLRCRVAALSKWNHFHAVWKKGKELPSLFCFKIAMQAHLGYI